MEDMIAIDRRGGGRGGLLCWPSCTWTGRRQEDTRAKKTWRINSEPGGTTTPWPFMAMHEPWTMTLWPAAVAPGPPSSFSSGSVHAPIAHSSQVTALSHAASSPEWPAGRCDHDAVLLPGSSDPLVVVVQCCMHARPAGGWLWLRLAADRGRCPVAIAKILLVPPLRSTQKQ